MNRHRARRWTAALINVLFLLAWGEPVTLHPCAAHDGVVVAASVASRGASAHAGDHVLHHAAVDAERTRHREHGADAAHACSCLGRCSAAHGVVVPTAQSIRWSAVVRRLVAMAHAEPAAPVVVAPRLLPFANGPPRSV